MNKSVLGKAFVIVYESALASAGADELTQDQRAILSSMIDDLVADRESAADKMRRTIKDTSPDHRARARVM
jgi:hypothetical protein